MLGWAFHLAGLVAVATGHLAVQALRTRQAAPRASLVPLCGQALGVVALLHAGIELVLLLLALLLFLDYFGSLDGQPLLIRHDLLP